MVEKGRHAREYGRADLLDGADVAVGAHHLAATGRKAKNVPVDAGVIHIPEGQVRREGKHVQHPVIAHAATHLRDTAAAETEIGDVVLRVEERHRLGRAAGRRGHEGRAPFPLEFIPHPFAPAPQGAQHDRRTPGEHRWIGLQHEFEGAARVVRRRQQILLGGEGDFLQVRDRADAVRRQPGGGEDLLIVLRERQHAVAQITVQLAALELDQSFPVEAVPILCQLSG